jgi:hypothetical protein
VHAHTGGAPAGPNALALCKDVFGEHGVECTPPRVHDTNEDPDSLFERGNQFRMQYMGTHSAALCRNVIHQRQRSLHIRMSDTTQLV